MTEKAEVKFFKLDEIKRAEKNPKKHDIAELRKSIRRFGFISPLLRNEKDGRLIAGHGRLEALQSLKEAGHAMPSGLRGDWEAPVITGLSFKNEKEAKAYLVADNRLVELGGWSEQELGSLLQDVQVNTEQALDGVGYSDAELAELLGNVEETEEKEQEEVNHGALAERFGIPPFSVLNAREGEWQSRKRAWLSMGISSELGRKGLGDTFDGVMSEKYRGRKNKGGDSGSVFDPVLCEMAYSWFSPPGGKIYDPFAGGSVRGVVAAKLGREYQGVELRPEQVQANREQWEEIKESAAPDPIWHQGDSTKVEVPKVPDADMVMSCPPYADLEVYSDDPADLSNMSYEEFVKGYREAIRRAVARLKDNRFIFWVIGEVRDKKGNYRDFVGDTVQAFRDAGAEYYNEAILITPLGTIPIRAGRHFSVARKMSKTHQNVLVFVKGDGKKAAQACGEVVVHVPEEPEKLDESEGQ